MPVTRRGLLAAGAVGGLALAGCGAPDDEPPPDAELLAPSLAAATALADVYEQAGGRLGDELAARERERGGQRRRQQLGIGRRFLGGAAARHDQARPRSRGEQAAPRHHQTVESRFSISSTGRV